VPYPPIYGYDFYKNKAKRSYILNIEKKMMSDKNGARQAKVRLSRNEYSMGEDKRERERERENIPHPCTFHTSSSINAI
jgi:hypothetical protein